WPDRGARMLPLSTLMNGLIRPRTLSWRGAMAEHDLSGKTVAILITNGVEKVELVEPRTALEEAGATAQIVSPEADQVRSWSHTDWGEEFDVDVPLERADAANFDAL